MLATFVAPAGNERTSGRIVGSTSILTGISSSLKDREARVPFVIENLALIG